MADKLKQIRETQHQRKFTRQDLIKYGFYCCQLPCPSPNLGSLRSAHWLWNYGSFHAVDMVAVEEPGGRGAHRRFPPLAGIETKPSHSEDSPLQVFCPSYGLDMAAVEDPLTGPPKSLLLMISRSLPTIKFMTSYEKRFKCARSTHSKRPRRAPDCGPKERPQPFAPLYALQYKRPIFTSFYKAWLFLCTSDYFVRFILNREKNSY